MKTVIAISLWLAVAFTIEGVFVACLNHDVFFVQNAVYTCRARQTTLTKDDIKEEL